MAGAEAVVQVAGASEFGGDHATAEPFVAFQHEHVLAGGRQIGDGDQPVVAGTDYDNVVI